MSCLIVNDELEIGGRAPNPSVAPVDMVPINSPIKIHHRTVPVKVPIVDF
jgi:hypothetical protein